MTKGVDIRLVADGKKQENKNNDIFSPNFA